jgi:hypothetical protein
METKKFSTKFKNVREIKRKFKKTVKKKFKEILFK